MTAPSIICYPITDDAAATILSQPHDTGAIRWKIGEEKRGFPVSLGEPYFRTDASRSRETGGVGLGLAIARHVAMMHGGDLRLENRSGGGLRATLVLPRNAPPAA